MQLKTKIAFLPVHPAHTSLTAHQKTVLDLNRSKNAFILLQPKTQAIC